MASGVTKVVGRCEQGVETENLGKYWNNMIRVCCKYWMVRKSAYAC